MAGSIPSVNGARNGQREGSDGNREREDNMNPDFMRGFWTAAGVLIAIYIVGIATGTLKRVI